MKFVGPRDYREEAGDAQRERDVEMNEKTYFLIYSRQQGWLAFWMVAVLRYLGLNILYDRSVRTGEKFSPELHKMIMKSDAAILLVTHDSLASDFCRREYKWMIKAGKDEVFPLMFDVPFSYVEERIEYAYEKLLEYQFGEIDANNPTESLLRALELPVPARNIMEGFDEFFRICQEKDSDLSELEQIESAGEPNSQPTIIQSLMPTLDARKKYRKAKSHFDEGEYQEALELFLEVQRHDLKDNDLKRLIRETKRAISMSERAS